MHHKKKALILHVNSNCYDYRNDPKFSDRQVYANSADLDQTASLFTSSLIWAFVTPITNR